MRATDHAARRRNLNEPPPRLVIIGAVHVAVALVHIANLMGYRTVVVDPRRAFASTERFGHAGQLHVAWPDAVLERLPLTSATAVAVLSHDPKIDLSALRLVLRRPVGYIGALGSPRTHAKRVAALLEEGFTEAEIGRIHAPIGLDIGGRKAEDIALSVMAEIVANRHGRA